MRDFRRGRDWRHEQIISQTINFSWPFSIRKLLGDNVDTLKTIETPATPPLPQILAEEGVRQHRLYNGLAREAVPKLSPPGSPVVLREPCEPNEVNVSCCATSRADPGREGRERKRSANGCACDNRQKSAPVHQIESPFHISREPETSTNST